VDAAVCNLASGDISHEQLLGLCTCHSMSLIAENSNTLLKVTVAVFHEVIQNYKKWNGKFPFYALTCKR